MINIIIYKEMYNFNDTSILVYSYVDIAALHCSARYPSLHIPLKKTIAMFLGQPPYLMKYPAPADLHVKRLWRE